MTSELSLCDRNFLTLSNSALACSPSLLSKLMTCLGLSSMTWLEGGKGNLDPRDVDVDDKAELQESVEGHGEGGQPKDAPPDLSKSGLSVPESLLVRLARVTGCEDEAEERGGCGARLSSSTTSFSWMLSCRAA